MKTDKDTYNPFSLNGKRVLVTGASSGIGRAVALQCAKLGASVFITGRDGQRLKETFDAMEGDRHRWYVADLSATVGREVLLTELPVLDGIVHAAGINKIVPFQFLTQEDIDQVFSINFYTPVHLIRLLLKQKKLAKGGSVVMISSIEGNGSAHMGNLVYSASKSALCAMARNMALELAPKKIRVNSVLPGMVETPLIRVFTDEQLEADKQRYPLKRYGTSEEIAYAVIYFLSDASAWTTGSSLVIDGGATL